MEPIQNKIANDAEETISIASIEAEDKLIDQIAYAIASVARQLYVTEKRNG
jgi:hypothetical protein